MKLPYDAHVGTVEVIVWQTADETVKYYKAKMKDLTLPY